MSDGEPRQPAYTCPFPGCGATSSNPDDVAQQFCGRCGRFFRDPLASLAGSQASTWQSSLPQNACWPVIWNMACWPQPGHSSPALQLVNRTTVDLVRKDIL